MEPLIFPIRCPECNRRVIGDIMYGLSRFKCHDCGRRVTVSCDGHETRVLQVDRPPAHLPVTSLTP